MEITDESRAKYFAMLVAFKATLTNADEQMVFEEAIAYDFRPTLYKEWLLQTDLNVKSRNACLQTLDNLVSKLIAYVEAITRD